MEEATALLSSSAKLWLFLCGVVTFPTLHFALTSLFLWKFPLLESGKAFRISTSTVSGLQAIAVVTVAARAVIVCKDIMNYEDMYIHAYIWFAVIYFPYDITVMYFGYFYTESLKGHHGSHFRLFIKFFKRQPVMVLHHIIFLAVGLPIVELYKKRIGDFFLCCFLLAEASTPFYSIRSILKELKIKNGRLYMVNGFLFLMTFLICRVLSVPLMFLRYSYYADIPLLTVPFNIPLKCTVVSTLFFMLQFYWFRLICLVAIRVFLHKEAVIETEKASTYKTLNGSLKHGNCTDDHSKTQ